tara:strand:- start:11932 stop:12417 length:486 start_codon:yes stop_codon:yes gene_type:complete
MRLLKILFLLIPLLLLSCTREPKNSEFDIDISEELAQIKKDLSPNIDKKDLIKLPTQDKVASDISIGNKNPFSAGSSVEKMILNNDLRLTGILSTKKELLAFVNYKGKSGALRIGDIGGQNTYLLPEGYKSISIDKSKGKLIIKFRNETYVLNVINKSKLP